MRNCSVFLDDEPVIIDGEFTIDDLKATRPVRPAVARAVVVEVRVQLKTADGSVAGSLGYESAVSRALKEPGLKLYPRHPG